MELTYDESSASVKQRAVADVGVAGDPADIRCAPVHIIRLVVKCVFKSGESIEHVASGRVQNTFRFTG